MRSLIILSWRNLWRNRRRTLITLSSIAFAVFMAILMRGFSLGTYEKIIDDTLKNSTGHVQLQSREYRELQSLDNIVQMTDSLREQLENDPAVTDIVYRMESGVLASSGERTKFAFVSGIDPDKEEELSALSKKIISGRALKKDDFGVVIGSGIATYLRLEVGDTLVLYGSGYQGMTAADLFPIVGIIKYPLPQVNNRIIYTPIGTAQYFFRTGEQYTTINLFIEDKEDAVEYAAEFNQRFDTNLVKAYDWLDLHADLVAQDESKQASGNIMTYVLYIIVGFGIFGTLLMMTMERRKEYGIMNALGLGKRQLLSITFLETIWLSGLGALLGYVLVAPLVIYFHLNPIQLAGAEAEMYEQFNIDPVLIFSVNPDYLITQGVIIMVISLLMSIVPMTSIYKLKISKALKL